MEWLFNHEKGNEFTCDIVLYGNFPVGHYYHPNQLVLALTLSRGRVTVGTQLRWFKAGTQWAVYYFVVIQVAKNFSRSSYVYL